MDITTLFKAFKIAMEKEDEAIKFYSDLASKIEDEELKELFADFADEEARHFERLSELYKAEREKITQSELT